MALTVQGLRVGGASVPAPNKTGELPSSDSGSAGMVGALSLNVTNGGVPCIGALKLCGLSSSLLRIKTSMTAKASNHTH